MRSYEKVFWDVFITLLMLCIVCLGVIVVFGTIYVVSCLVGAMR
jgi:hypothetical protein